MSFSTINVEYAIATPIKTFKRHKENLYNHPSQTSNSLVNSLPSMPDGRHYPVIPDDNFDLIKLIINLDKTIKNPSTPESHLPYLAHKQQVIYRRLALNKDKSEFIITNLPLELKDTVKKHLIARNHLVQLSKKYKIDPFIPAWTIIPPEPIHKLLLYYLKAEHSTGIDWEILAAINLIESGMGRIKGLSVASAQGPMQFLPTTWNEPGIGQGGDINDPHDSIQAAARYLVRRGALSDLKKGLWGYNNNDDYGLAVIAYASLLRVDPLAYLGLYNWEIHFNYQDLDLWIPVGFDSKQKVPLSTFIKDLPASTPPDYDPTKLFVFSSGKGINQQSR